MPKVRIMDSFHSIDFFSFATISPMPYISIPGGNLLLLSLTLFNDVGVECIFFFIGGYGGRISFFCISVCVSRSVSSGNTSGFVFLKETLSETQTSD